MLTKIMLLILLLLMTLSGCGTEVSTQGLPVFTPHDIDARLKNVSMMFPISTADGPGLLLFRNDEQENTRTLQLAVFDEKMQVAQLIDIPIQGIPHQALSADTDGDGAVEILIAYGYGRGKLEDPVRVVQYSGKTYAETRVLYEVQSPRAQVVALFPSDDGFGLWYFDSKYFVQRGVLAQADGKWQYQKGERLRVATNVDAADWDSDGKEDLLIGKPYGEQIGEDGYALLQDAEGSTKLPTFRGVSSVKFAQLDRDDELEILVGDGWHQNYGQLAEPRLTMFDHRGKWEPKLIDTAKPQYSIDRIEVLEQDGQQYVLAAGDRQLRVYDPADWTQRTVHEKSKDWSWDFAVLRADGEEYIAVLDGDVQIFSIG